MKLIFEDVNNERHKTMRREIRKYTTTTTRSLSRRLILEPGNDTLKQEESVNFPPSSHNKIMKL